MKKRRLILIMIGLFGAVVAMIFIWPGEQEPGYQGKKLSEWLADYTTVGDYMRLPPESSEQSREAVLRIGTRALPCMLEWIHCGPPQWKRNLFGVANRLPGKTSRRLAMKLWVHDTKSNRDTKALSAFRILGPVARPAIPELARMLNDPGWPYAAEHAAEALKSIGPEALPSLLGGLTNKNVVIRQRVGMILMRSAVYWTNAAIAVPALAQSLGDKNDTVVELSAITLGNLKTAPEIAVPAMTNHLRTPRMPAQWWILRALGEFGEAARPAVPTLLPFLTDHDPRWREAAEEALRKIAPELLTTNSEPQDAKP